MGKSWGLVTDEYHCYLVEVLTVADKEQIRKTGRPSDYTPELAESICLLLSEGQSLRAICREDCMPDKATVLRWIARHPEFRDQYALAKEQAAEALAEELFDIADDGANDWMEQLDGEGEVVGYKLNGEHVQRSKLRIDTRKWYLSKIMPKKYGDRIQHDQRITFTDLSDDELDSKIQELTHAQSGSGAED